LAEAIDFAYAGGLTRLLLGVHLLGQKSSYYMSIHQHIYVLSIFSGVLALEEVSNYTFANYINDFQRTYKPGSDEYQKRAAIFQERAAEVQKHNAVKSTWKKGINHLTDRTSEELSQLNGYKRWMRKAPEAPAASSFLQLGEESEFCASQRQKCDGGSQSCCSGLVCGTQGLCEEAAELPEEFDEWSRLPTANEIFHQGECGSCWAVAATAAIQLQAVINTGSQFHQVLSPQNMLSCTENPYECGGQGMCKGATGELGLAWLENVGTNGGLYPMSHQKYTAAPTPDSCPGAQSKSFLQVRSEAGVSIQGWKKIQENNAHEMMKHLVTVGPLVASVVGDPSLQSYSSGVIDQCPSPIIDHAVLMMGYGRDDEQGLKYWKIRNSWGTNWGEKGYFRLQRFYPGEEEPCEMDTDPAKGTACKDQPGPLGHYPAKQEVCGKCGILSDTAYPIGTRVPEWMLDSVSAPM